MKSQWRLVTALTLALLASLGVPDLVTADHSAGRKARPKPDPNAALYEVTENLKLAPLQLGQRVATAVLSGTVAVSDP